MIGFRGRPRAGGGGPMIGFRGRPGAEEAGR